MTDLHVTDVGTEIRVTVLDNGTDIVDCSPATAKKFLFKHKSGSTFARDASFYTDGKDGKLSYFLVGGDIVLSGKWELQVYLEFTSGSWHSSKATFEADPNIIVEGLL